MRIAAVLFAVGCLFGAGCGSSKTGWRDVGSAKDSNESTKVTPHLVGQGKPVPFNDTISLSGARNSSSSFTELFREPTPAEKDAENSNWEAGSRAAMSEGLKLLKHKLLWKDAKFMISKPVIFGPPHPEAATPKQIELQLEASVRGMTFAEFRKENDSANFFGNSAIQFRDTLGWDPLRYVEWAKPIRADTRDRMDKAEE